MRGRVCRGMSLRQARQMEPFRWSMIVVGEGVWNGLLSRSIVVGTSITVVTSEDMVVDATIGIKDPGRSGLSM